MPGALYLEPGRTASETFAQNERKPLMPPQWPSPSLLLFLPLPRPSSQLSTPSASGVIVVLVLLDSKFSSPVNSDPTEEGLPSSAPRHMRREGRECIMSRTFGDKYIIVPFQLDSHEVPIADPQQSPRVYHSGQRREVRATGPKTSWRSYACCRADGLPVALAV